MLYNFIIKNLILIIITLILTIIIILIEAKEYLYKKNGITPQDAIKLINNNNAIVIDLRSEKDFNNEHIINSINIQVHQLDEKKLFINKNKKKIIIIIEDKKYNYKNIKKILEKNDCKNIMYIIDGINSWKKNELPTYRKN